MSIRFFKTRQKIFVNCFKKENLLFNFLGKFKNMNPHYSYLIIARRKLISYLWKMDLIFLAR